MARPKGSSNKDNQVIKDMIRLALSRKGGAEYFERQADENPASFMTLIGKLIPAEVNLGGQKDNPIQTQNVTETDKEIIQRYMQQQGQTDAPAIH